MRARLYATAHGLYEATLNGHRVGDQVLAPGWTSYGHRLRYQTYDVTGLVREGGNDLEVLLGNGWYRGRLGWDGRHAHYGDRLALLAQLEVTTSDGQVIRLGTDASWMARESGSWPTTSMTASGPTCVPGASTAPTPSRSSTPTWPAWSRPTARRSGSPRPCPRPPSSPRRPAPPWSTSGRTSSAGCGSGSGTRPRARRSWSGTPRCWTGSWGPAAADRQGHRLLPAGRRALEVLEPSLTFHGFRYAEISGLPEVRAEDVEAVVVGSDLRRTGWFSSSDPQLNRFHENVVWGMRGTSWTCQPTVPSATSGWAGPVTSRCSRPRPASCSTAPAS